MKATCHSEYGALRSVWMKRPQEAFVHAAKIDREWRALNFLSAPDLDQAAKEFVEFENLLKRGGASVHHLPEDNSTTLDSLYCRDAAMATNRGVILCNMGKAARAAEPRAIQAAWEAEGLPVLGAIRSPGTVEGGDVAWIDEGTLAVGRTYRTNDAGIAQLRALLAPLGVKVWVAEMPHYRGPSDVFHLMSVLSPVDKNLAVVYSPLMPIAFREGLVARGYQLVEVPDTEFDTMACNVLALAPRVCLMVEGNPLTKKRLEEAGAQVHTYKGVEISLKGGGGPTCLTRPIERWT
jgi:N-dimethylarginine dimethylaminohydrolase